VIAPTPVIVVAPLSHEASDGRFAASVPAAANRVQILVDGAAVPAGRVVFTHARAGSRRVTFNVATTARSGATIEIRALDSSQLLGSASVADVSLLGPDAFAAPKTRAVSPRATAAAVAIERAAPGTLGFSANCLGSGLGAEANSTHVAVAASTLKLPILLDLLARRNDDPVSDPLHTVYSEVVVESSNDAANELLGIIGNGSVAAGAKAVNTFMRGLGMGSSYLDGPYRLGGGPSLKRTTAHDLSLVANDLLLAAEGTGPLTGLGVTRREARVVISLMAKEDYPGLIRDNVPGPVAHKAGWLSDVQNDVALAFGTPAGTCVIAVTAEGVTFSAADAIGRQLAERVLPLLRAVQGEAAVRGHAPPVSTQSSTPRPPTSRAAVPPKPHRSRTRAEQSSAPSAWWAWTILAAGLLLATAIAVRLLVQARQRKKRRAYRMRRTAQD
jgi:Beta-lactamase enzyme family